MLYSLVSVCHQQKPPVCFATKRICRAPNDLATLHHWSVSSWVGLIWLNSVEWLSYSLPCQVQGSRHRNISSSIWCQEICSRVGIPRSTGSSPRHSKVSSIQSMIQALYFTVLSSTCERLAQRRGLSTSAGASGSMLFFSTSIPETTQGVFWQPVRAPCDSGGLPGTSGPSVVLDP